MGQRAAKVAAHKGSGPGTAGTARRHRTVRKVTVKEQETTEVEQGVPLRPAQCRAYMRRTLAKEFRGIVAGFVKGAKAGSCQHVKLATELLEPGPKTKRTPSGQRTLERWLDELERGV